MKHLRYIFVAIMAIFVSGCNYLDIVPEDDVETIETVFEKREDVDTWLKTCYALAVNQFTSVIHSPSFVGADEFVAGDYARLLRMATTTGKWCGLFIGDGLQMSQEPYGNIWKNDGLFESLRYINIFIEKIDQVYNMQDSEKELWIAEIKALKAHIYLEFLKTYGPFIIIDENIAVNSDISDMQLPRSSIDECVKAIVTLCDEAIEVLPNIDLKDTSRKVFHNKSSVAVVKAYALLYAASPIFNGNSAYREIKNKNGELLFPQEYDKEKWKVAAEAIDQAIEYATLGGVRLYNDSRGKVTDLLNHITNIQESVMDRGLLDNVESIYAMRPNSPAYRYTFRTLPVVPYTSPVFTPHSDGQIFPSLNVVERYYTVNGLPIESDINWDYTNRYQMGTESSTQYTKVVPSGTDVLKLHLAREPRFYANIAADRLYWQQGAGDVNNLLVKARQDEAVGVMNDVLNTSLPQNLSGYILKKGLDPLLSFKDIEDAGSKDYPFIIFRLAELYLMQAEAWNEYEGPTEKVYDAIDIVRKRAGIPDVRTSWSTYSNDADKPNTIEGMREIIHDEWNNEFAFEGKRFYNVRRWLTAETELNQSLRGWNTFSNTEAGFYNNFEGPLEVWKDRKFTSPRDYLFPIRAEEVMISGVTQNLGW